MSPRMLTCLGDFKTAFAVQGIVQALDFIIAFHAQAAGDRLGDI
jgi:hypothetical protein